MENPAPYGNQIDRERRERIATAAMQGLLVIDRFCDPGHIARTSLAYADALIAELDKDKL